MMVANAAAVVLHNNNKEQENFPPANQSPNEIFVNHKNESAFSHRSHKFKRTVEAMFDPSATTRLASMVQWFVLLLILASTLIMVLESMTSVASADADKWGIWLILEIVCVGCFTVEYILRLAATSNIRSFFFDVLNFVDLISILPFWIELILESILNTNQSTGTVAFRVLRLLRILRILKLSRYSVGLQIVGDTIAKSSDILLLLFFLTGISMVFFASLIWYAEAHVWDPDTGDWRTDDGSRSAFQNIAVGCYWAMITLTTVGYGDKVPVTPWGKVVACVAMMGGVITISMPISILGSTFTACWESRMVGKENKDVDAKVNKKIFLQTAAMFSQITSHEKLVEEILLRIKAIRVAKQEMNNTNMEIATLTKEALQLQAKHQIVFEALETLIRPDNATRTMVEQDREIINITRKSYSEWRQQALAQPAPLQPSIQKFTPFPSGESL